MIRNKFYNKLKKLLKFKTELFTFLCFFFGSIFQEWWWVDAAAQMDAPKAHLYTCTSKKRNFEVWYRFFAWQHSA